MNGAHDLNDLTIWTLGHFDLLNNIQVTTQVFANEEQSI